MVDETALATLQEVRALSGDSYRDVEGVDLIAALARRGYNLGEVAFDNLLKLLREAGLLNYYRGGSGDPASITAIRLTPAGLAHAERPPDPPLGVVLEREQEDLLNDLVEAARDAPREQREFSYFQHMSGERLEGPAGFVREGPGQVIGHDLWELTNTGLVTTTRQNVSGEQDFVVASKGFAYVRERAGTPFERSEDDARRLVASEQFRANYPQALARWVEAEALLRDASSLDELTTIGHKAREAVQAFATGLVARHQPKNVEADATKVNRRIGAVIAMHRAGLGEGRRRTLEALGDLWEATVELIQRQEHAALKEGEPLTWHDGRRVVLLTLVLMTELSTTLDEAHGDL
jgi:hypothetical protein